MAYRGREWLQRLLNTLGDERGRDPVKDSLSKTGGAWLYMFPTLQGRLALLGGWHSMAPSYFLDFS